MAGFFTVEGSDDFGKTWMEEITEPAADLRQATVLLRQDLARTSSEELSRTVLTLWDKGKGVAVVSDSGRPLSLDRHHWRFSYTES